MEVLKDAFDALSQRIRSPFLGSIILVFVGFNWQPLWYLLFADKPVREKFLYFEANTDIWSLYALPISFGVVLALVIPWTRLFGAWVAAQPTRRLKGLQSAEAMKLRIASMGLKAEEENAIAEYERASEQRKIDAAQRLEAAKEISDDLSQQIVEERKSATEDQIEKMFPMQLSDEQVIILEFAAEYLNGSFQRAGNRLRREGGAQNSPVLVYGKGHRGTIELEADLSELRKRKLLSSESSRKVSELNVAGYSVLDDAKAKHGDLFKTIVRLNENIEIVDI